MSNILIIKHGSLGDIVQISGVLKDIRETYNQQKIFLLTTFLGFLYFPSIKNKRRKIGFQRGLKLKHMLPRIK